MTNNEIFTKVADLLAGQLPVTVDQIRPDSKLVEDLGADSANIMILVFDVESEFDIQVDNDMLMSISTVKDVVDCIEKAIG